MGCILWFVILIIIFIRVVLFYSGSLGVVLEGNGIFFDDIYNVSEWWEVFIGEEILFEFEVRGKLRYRYIYDFWIY